MPLFGKTFSPKKTPPRKCASLSNLHSLDRSTREIELGLDYGIPTMNLAGQSLKFENGQWVAESGSFTGDRREMQRLRKRNQQLEEENNLLRLKVDILLDMVSLCPTVTCPRHFPGTNSLSRRCWPVAVNLGVISVP
uniref:Chibby family member 1, beta catenin antagonist n=1 Tax=Accipiter nisus TaxID=211598 RepID=A0A8B9N9E3_9AVES